MNRSLPCVVVVLAVAAALPLSGACGGGPFTAAPGDASADRAPTSDSGPGRGDGCVPKTACGPQDCGMHSDGCGGQLECGSGMCSTRQECILGFCVCKPDTCVSLGAECGQPDDGCGKGLDCGSCEAGPFCGGPQADGGAGTPYVCGTSPCTPISQSMACEGVDCGSKSDKCSASYSCGTCPMLQTCGGGTPSVPNICGCTPTTCGALGACGSQPDGCGNSLQCPCPDGGTPQDSGPPPGDSGMGPAEGGSMEACSPLQCTQGQCDHPMDGCGGTLNCPVCASPQTCGGGGTPNVCGCVPTMTCASQGYQCGTFTDDCGSTQKCGDIASVPGRDGLTCLAAPSNEMTNFYGCPACDGGSGASCTTYAANSVSASSSPIAGHLCTAAAIGSPAHTWCCD